MLRSIRFICTISENNLEPPRKRQTRLLSEQNQQRKRDILLNKIRKIRRRQPDAESRVGSLGFPSYFNAPFGHSDGDFHDFLTNLGQENRPASDVLFGTKNDAEVSHRRTSNGDNDHMQRRIDFSEILDQFYEEDDELTTTTTSTKKYPSNYFDLLRTADEAKERLSSTTTPEPRIYHLNHNSPFAKRPLFESSKATRPKRLKIKKRIRPFKTTTTDTTTSPRPLPISTQDIENFRQELSNSGLDKEPFLEDIKASTQQFSKSKSYQKFKLGSFESTSRRYDEYESLKSRFFEAPSTPSLSTTSESYSSAGISEIFPTFYKLKNYRNPLKKNNEQRRRRRPTTTTPSTTTTTTTTASTTSIATYKIDYEDAIEEKFTKGPFYYKPIDGVTTIKPKIDQYSAPEDKEVEQFHDINAMRKSDPAVESPVKQLVKKLRQTFNRQNRITQTAAVMLPYTLLFAL